MPCGMEYSILKIPKRPLTPPYFSFSIFQNHEAMYITFTEGPRDVHDIASAWKENRPVRLLVEYRSTHIKQLKNKDLKSGVIYGLELRFQDFTTVKPDKCILTQRMSTTGELAGYGYDIVCDLTDGTGHIKAKKVY